MLGMGLIGLRFGPLEESESVNPVGAADYSRQYLFWRNATTGTVTLYGIWSGSAFTTVEYTAVVVKQLRTSTQAPEFSGVQLRNDQCYWMIPVAMIGGNVVKSGDKITSGAITWIVDGDVPLMAVGNSPSHYVALTNKERG